MNNSIPQTLQLNNDDKERILSLQTETNYASENHWTKAILKGLSVLRINLEIELSEGKDIKNVLIRNGIRYRLIEPEKIDSNRDYGVLIASSTNGTQSYVMHHEFSKSRIYMFDGSQNDSSYTVENITEFLNTCSQVVEVYPPLPYKLNDLWGFLMFIFDQFERDLIFVALFTSLAMGLQLLFPQLTVYVASNVITLGSIPFALQVGILAVLLAVVSTGALYLQSEFILKLETETDKRAQVSVWDRLLKADLENISKFSSADLMLRASTIGEIKKLMSSSNIASLIGILFSFLYLGIMYSYFPEPLIGVLPLTIGFVFFVVNRAKTGGVLLSHSLDERAKLTSASYDLLLLQQELRSRASENKFLDKWLGVSKEYAYLSKSYRRRDTGIEILSAAFQPICFLVSFIIIESSLSPEDWGDSSILLPLLGYTSSLTLFTSNLSAGANTVADSFVRVMAYWKRAIPIVFTPIETGYKPGSKAHNLEGSIALENVSVVDRKKERTIFENLTFKVNPNTINLIQTIEERKVEDLFDILLSIEQCNSGSVLLSGIPINQHSIPSLRSQVAISANEPYIPMGALGDILEGPLTDNDDDFMELLTVLELDNLLDKLRMGLDTPIPEGGKCFSTNQLQRLSIGMALARYPKVILIENALDGFDNDQLKDLFKYLKSKSITTLAYESIIDTDRKSLYDSTINLD